VRVTTAFNRILRVPGATITAVTITGGEVVAEIRTKSRRLRCPCGFRTWAVYDRSVRRWRHLDVASSKLWLKAEIRRLDCPDCGVRTEDVAWARPGARHTRDFEDVVAWLSQRADKTTVARLLRCAWETVDRIVGRVVDDHLDDGRLDGLVHVGVDEISYRRGHKYLTVVACHDTGRVVWIAEGRTKEALKSFFDALGPDRRSQIAAVSMDMASIYREATRESVPHAAICLDPFHAMKWVNEALERVYTSTPRGEFDGRISGLEWRRTRVALRTGMEHLTVTQHWLVQRIRRRRFQLWRAWELKERFRDLYRLVDPDDAGPYLKAWCTAALRSRIPAFKTLVRRIRKHFDGIAAAVEWNLSNSRLEGVNSKIRLINNRAHGHRSVPALTASIYLCLGGITVQLPTQT
jgi:transposase